MKLKLGPLTNDKSDKLTVEHPATVHAISPVAPSSLNKRPQPAPTKVSHRSSDTSWR
jgi:hypothetical protein